MAWSLVGVSAVTTSASDNFTAAEPSGTQEGDLLIVVIATRFAAASTDWAPFSGEWTVVETEYNEDVTANSTSSVGCGFMAYCVRGASAPSSMLFSSVGTNIYQGACIAYRGNADTSPLDVSSSLTAASASTQVTTGALTTTEADELIVAVRFGARSGTVSNFDATDPGTASGATDTTTAPTAGTWIERLDASTTSGADCALGLADAIKSTAGSTGTISCDHSSSARHSMIAAAFKIASGAPAEAIVNGAQTVPAVTSGGTVAVGLATAGAQNAPSVASTGTVAVGLAVAGAQNAPSVTSTGAMTAPLALDGSQFVTVGHAATAAVDVEVDGSQSAPAVTSTGTIELSFGVAGDQVVPTPTSSATADVDVTVTGAQSLPVAQSATVTVPRNVAGAQSITVAQSATAGQLSIVNGAQEVDPPVSTGTVAVPRNVEGAQEVTHQQLAEAGLLGVVDGAQDVPVDTTTGEMTLVEFGAAIVNGAQIIPKSQSGTMSAPRNVAAAQIVVTVNNAIVSAPATADHSAVMPSVTSGGTVSAPARVTGAQAVEVGHTAEAAVRVRVTGAQTVPAPTQDAFVHAGGESGGNQVVRPPLQTGTISVLVEVDGAQVFPTVQNDLPPARFSPVKLQGRGSGFMLRGQSSGVSLQGRARKPVRVP